MEETSKLNSPAFATLIQSLTHSALASMGMIPESEIKKNKTLAEFNIDMLILLKEKTKGNLSVEEEELLNNCIQDLQITFSEQNFSEK